MQVPAQTSSFLCWSTSSGEPQIHGGTAVKWRPHFPHWFAWISQTRMYHESQAKVISTPVCVWTVWMSSCDNSSSAKMIFTKVHNSFEDFSCLSLGSVLSENADHTTSFAMHSACVGLAALRMPACSVRNGFPPSSKVQGPFIRLCLSFVATEVKCPENYI